MHNFQVHHPDLVAQAAGHLSRDEYSGYLGIDPEDREEFQEMSNLLWSWLQSQIEQLHLVIIHPTLTKAIVSLLSLLSSPLFV